MKSITVPDEIYEQAAKRAEERHIPVQDLILSAIVDQMAAQEHISRRRTRSSEESFRRALDQIPDHEPEERDRL
jgi:hypothetical protein